jgi:hypothetical protein
MSVTKVYVDPNYRSNRKRIEEDEKELETLMGKQQEQEPEKDEKEEVPPVVVKEAEEPSDPEEKSFKKRYGDLRRHMAEKEKEWEAKFEQLTNQTTKTSILPPKSDEDIAAWASKYPDIAAIVETIATKKADEKLSKYQNKFEEYEKLTYETTRTKAMNTIRESHPDFDDLKRSDKFHEWVDEQPKWVQDALYENEEDAHAVVRVLDLYKVDKGLTPSAKKAQSKEAASLVQTKSKANVDFDKDGEKIYESRVNKMSSQEFAKHEGKIMEAIRKGNFVYDISGGAR